ncbi:MAG: hypothetical protein CMQ52_05200 [Gammaproteobacteria bacterium]|nr:hypothetical protein [Gammaproteobacteria bacterium]
MKQLKKYIVVALFVLFLLLIPFAMMLLTDHIRWSLLDFIMAGILLFITISTIHFIFKKIKNTKYFFVISIVFLTLMLLIWIEIAVVVFT